MNFNVQKSCGCEFEGFGGYDCDDYGGDQKYIHGSNGIHGFNEKYDDIDGNYDHVYDGRCDREFLYDYENGNLFIQFCEREAVNDVI